jgi:hypothetical protein
MSWTLVSPPTAGCPIAAAPVSAAAATTHKKIVFKRLPSLPNRRPDRNSAGTPKISHGECRSKAAQRPDGFKKWGKKRGVTPRSIDYQARAAKLLADAIFESPTSGKRRKTRRRDHDRLTGLRVPTLSLLSFPNLESAEPGNLDLLAGVQLRCDDTFLRDGAKNRVAHDFGVLKRHSGFVGYFLNELGFVHIITSFPLLTALYRELKKPVNKYFAYERQIRDIAFFCVRVDFSPAGF